MFYAVLKSISQKKSVVIVELKNDLKIKGNLVDVDENLNLHLSKMYLSDKETKENNNIKSNKDNNINNNLDIDSENLHQLKYGLNTFIRGNTVRYIHFNKKDVDLKLIEEACRKINTENNED